ncbi:MAG: polysaccharide biosynthesis/export family protein [Pseudodonghicola sp.]
MVHSFHIPFSRKSFLQAPSARRALLRPGRGAVSVAGGALLLLLALIWAPRPAQAATQVERGDLLTVEVVDAKMFSRQARVDADGRIMLPAIGGLEVAGRDLDQIRGMIETALSQAGLMHQPVVLVEFAEYRPVYVGGAVAQPGAIAYLPGMTAQQALIAAGGLKLRSKEDDIAPDALIEAVAQSQASAFQLVQTQARIARLEAALANSDEIGTAAPRAGNLPDKTVREVMQSESLMLHDQLARLSSRQAHGQNLAALLDLELEILGQQAQLQQDEAGIQTEEVANAKKLVDQGLMPRPRLQELMREKSQLSRDLLETRAFAARAQQAKETARFEIADEETERRIELRRELQEAQRDKVRIEATLQALRARLLTVGLAQDGNSALAAPVAKLVIQRQRAGVLTEIGVTPGTPMLPGDVLEVSIDTALPG